ncbi:hypothetical protein ACIBL5_38955 [Streptomyces sp. NPDC050516]|uniref:hypothetical protein n=1 Tax=Streptomyces sp. NPDC050516 TaxID=3365621 RepID=UPI0037BD6C04
MAQGPLAAASNSLSLQHAYDLLGGTRCWEPRYSLGTFPLRLPQEVPDDVFLRSPFLVHAAPQEARS